MRKKLCTLVVAYTPSGGIGQDNDLPWPRLSKDWERLRSVTSETRDGSKQNAVVMGRRTFESIARPLKGRVNVVISRSTQISDYPNGVLVFQSVKEALVFLEDEERVESVHILGGSGIYEAALKEDLVDVAFVTRVGMEFPHDTKFPIALLLSKFAPVHTSATFAEADVPFDFVEYRPLASLVPGRATRAGEAGELQYLELVEKILSSGWRQMDRTGVGCVSVFGALMRFDLSQSFPLLTTKRVFWKGVVEELLWFLKGDTNANHLSAKGVKIWDGNGSKEFLEARGLGHREEGDLGPVYGFQWRHFGAEYETMHSDYQGQGVDQLMECINQIKNNPNDRRIVMSAWNPKDLPQMALPPCHMFCQFYVADGKLSCAMYQRSCDMGLGVPFNIASYALLTVMMAQVCGLQPGEFVHHLGHAHVYLNHVDPLKEQLKRHPRPFPILKVNKHVTDIDKFTFEDFELLGYDPHPKIEMQMAV